jgi:hypothetical protein
VAVSASIWIPAFAGKGGRLGEGDELLPIKPIVGAESGLAEGVFGGGFGALV